MTDRDLKAEAMNAIPELRAALAEIMKIRKSNLDNKIYEKSRYHIRKHNKLLNDMYRIGDLVLWMENTMAAESMAGYSYLVDEAKSLIGRYEIR